MVSKPPGTCNETKEEISRSEEFHFIDSVDRLREKIFNTREVRLNQTSENSENMSKFQFSEFSNVQFNLILHGINLSAHRSKIIFFTSRGKKIPLNPLNEK